jgi:hypothetical protein
VAGGIQSKIKVLFVIINLLYLTGSCSSPANTTDLQLYSTDSIQSGDIILRKGYGLISEMIAKQLNDTIDVSHCGIIVKDKNHFFFVIHSLSKTVSDEDGVQICSLSSFINDSQIETVKVVRFRNDSNGKIAAKAFYYLKRKIPFDEKFNSNDTTAFYCSEFPIHIINSTFNIKINTYAGYPKFSIFLNPVYFDEIPFLKKTKQR